MISDVRLAGNRASATEKEQVVGEDAGEASSAVPSSCRRVSGAGRPRATGGDQQRDDRDEVTQQGATVRAPRREDASRDEVPPPDGGTATSLA